MTAEASGPGGAIRRRPAHIVAVVVLALLAVGGAVLWWQSANRPDDLPRLLERATKQVGGGEIANFYHAPGILNVTVVTDSETRTLEYQHDLWGDELRDTTDPDAAPTKVPFHLPLDRLDAEGILVRTPDAGACERERIGITVQATATGAAPGYLPLLPRQLRPRPCRPPRRRSAAARPRVRGRGARRRGVLECVASDG